METLTLASHIIDSDVLTTCVPCVDTLLTGIDIHALKVNGIPSSILCVFADSTQWL